MIRIATMVAAAGFITAGQGAAWTGDGAAAFVGHWRVTGVAVPDDGVQALTDNDPTYMGKWLTFTAGQLAWDAPAPNADHCANPRFTRAGQEALQDLRPQLRKLGMPDPTPFTIRCQSGRWGPANDAVIFRGAGGALALPWYDGGLLKLTRR